MNLEEKTKRLSIDSAFGILTRNALEIEIEEKIKSPFDLILIDFCDVHRMNDLFGYEAVNRTFRGFFRKVRTEFPDVLIGRWFSGDEIAIIINANQAAWSVVCGMRRIADVWGLSFREICLYDQTDLNKLSIERIGRS